MTRLSTCWSTPNQSSRFADREWLVALQIWAIDDGLNGLDSLGTVVALVENGSVSIDTNQ